MAIGLLTYAKEFVAIYAHLQKKHPELCRPDRQLVTQAELTTLLDRNKYEESHTKLAVWRDLQWIDCEPGHYTRNTKVNGKQQRYIHLRGSVYKRLCIFLDGNPK